MKNLNNIRKYDNLADDTKKAILLLQETGAGLTQQDYDNLENKDGFKVTVSRNDGIIGITEKDMEETRIWEEGRVEIWLDKDDEPTILFDVFSYYDSNDLKTEYPEINENDLLKLNFNNCEMNVEEVEDLFKNCNCIESNGFFYKRI